MIVRRRAQMRGTLQGVGLRPCVARLAHRHRLAGFVRNDGTGVTMEVEGPPDAITDFARALGTELPAPARVDEIEWSDRPLQRDDTFEIVASEDTATATQLSIAADRRTCDPCLTESRSPEGRHFHHPFVACTECGPRFTIALAQPYDRVRSTMASFPMCPRCRAEFSDPSERRFHAQTLACPHCGPQVTASDPAGRALAHGPEAIEIARAALQKGEIVALRGIGGFQLLVDATATWAVRRLRDRKRRPTKPLAVMVGGVDEAERIAVLTAADRRALCSPAGPIVLVPKREGVLPEAVAPGCDRVGVMLPTTALHAMLLDLAGHPLVATSGNRNDDPIVFEHGEAFARLGEIADVFLHHDRDIARPADDSVVHVVGGETRVLRLGRGYAPLCLPLEVSGEPWLALGGHLKVAPALVEDHQVVLWPHVGDLHGPSARAALERTLQDMQDLCRLRAGAVVSDAHPDYATTLWAEASGRPHRRVWHHDAHVAAVLAEYGASQALGFAWDGFGLGPDGSLWGGEVLDVGTAGFTRVAHFAPFAVPGVAASARDGRRALAGMLAGLEGPHPELGDTMARLCKLARNPAFATPTTSVGRMFDAVAALTGVCTSSTYEGEAASRLESIARGLNAAPYPFGRRGPVIDWRPTLTVMLAERHDAPRVAARFHATLVAIAVSVAVERRAPVVALSGGCFQNRSLVEAIQAALSERGIRVLVPKLVPPGDGGLALGQAWVALHRGWEDDRCV